MTVAGQAFSVSGEGDLPVQVAAGGTYSFSVNFSPAATGAATGQLTITSNSKVNGTLEIGLSGTGAAASSTSLSSLSCASGSVTGAGTDRCAVTLNAAAASGGLTVGLASNNSAVTVPASVAVPAGATSASFTANVSPVSTMQTATLTASADGISESFALQLDAAVIAAPALSVSATNLDFGGVGVNTAVTQSLTLSSTGTAPVTVSTAGVLGSGFSMSGEGFPVTLNPGQTSTLSVQFDPTTVGTATGSLTFASNSSMGSPTVVNLSGTGVPVLSALSCNIGSMTGAGTDNCTVMLNAATASGGFTVSLAASNGAVTVPATVTVPAGLNSASFTATVSSVSTAQTIMLIATAGGISKSFPLQLNVGTGGLNINATNVAFGSVPVNTTATQSVALTASGALPITVTAATVVGDGFSISGATFPLVLTDEQAATLEIAFDPTTAGATTGQLIILSTSLANGATVINLSGTGVPLQVSLSWDAPSSSPDPVAGYHIYRSPDGGTSYELLNLSIVTDTAFLDTTVQNGQTYDYIVESVDASGTESPPSNMASVTIP